jgi:hypothetical protein
MKTEKRTWIRRNACVIQDTSCKTIMTTPFMSACLVPSVQIAVKPEILTTISSPNWVGGVLPIVHSLSTAVLSAHNVWERSRKVDRDRTIQPMPPLRSKGTMEPVLLGGADCLESERKLFQAADSCRVLAIRPSITGSAVSSSTADPCGPPFFYCSTQCEGNRAAALCTQCSPHFREDYTGLCTPCPTGQKHTKRRAATSKSRC